MASKDCSPLPLAAIVAIISALLKTGLRSVKAWSPIRAAAQRMPTASALASVRSSKCAASMQQLTSAILCTVPCCNCVQPSAVSGSRLASAVSSAVAMRNGGAAAEANMAITRDNRDSHSSIGGQATTGSLASTRCSASQQADNSPEKISVLSW